MGIRVATDAAWRHAPSGQQGLSKNKAHPNATTQPHDAKACNGLTSLSYEKSNVRAVTSAGFFIFQRGYEWNTKNCAN